MNIVVLMKQVPDTYAERKLSASDNTLDRENVDAVINEIDEYAIEEALTLRDGTLTTDVTWTSPAGRTVRLEYLVTTDRVRKHAALVRLTVTPEFTGSITQNSNSADPPV